LNQHPALLFGLLNGDALLGYGIFIFGVLLNFVSGGMVHANRSLGDSLEGDCRQPDRESGLSPGRARRLETFYDDRVSVNIIWVGPRGQPEVGR
jgi:hypothetical protein